MKTVSKHENHEISQKFKQNKSYLTVLLNNQFYFFISQLTSKQIIILYVKNSRTDNENFTTAEISIFDNFREQCEFECSGARKYN